MQRWKSELAPTLLLQMEHPPLRLEPLLPDDDPASRLRLTVGQEVPDEYHSDDGESLLAKLNVASRTESFSPRDSADDG
jgi:hypothetical protein